MVLLLIIEKFKRF